MASVHSSASSPAPSGSSSGPEAFFKRWKLLVRSQISAFIAGVVDFGTLIACVERFHFFYPIGVALGAFLGAVTNFLINRHWSFEAAHRPVGTQARRYALISTGSLLLNTGGVYFVHEVLGPNYIFSKVFIAIAVALFYNYPLHRNYVYSEVKS